MNEPRPYFLLEREWLNYKYKLLTRTKAETMLHRAFIKDSVCLGNALIMRLYIKWPEQEVIMKAESGIDGEGKPCVEYASADILKDRLAGHEMPKIHWGQ